MSVKALGFNKTGAVQTEPALASVLCRLLLNTLLSSGGSREEEQFAVGQNSIHIEKQQHSVAPIHEPHASALERSAWLQPPRERGDQPGRCLDVRERDHLDGRVHVAGRDGHQTSRNPGTA